MLLYELTKKSTKRKNNIRLAAADAAAAKKIDKDAIIAGKLSEATITSAPTSKRRKKTTKKGLLALLTI